LAPRRQILTREDWIEAARKVLVAAGVDDVKVDRLSRQLKVTRGSFYWHFKNRKDLIDALLDGWKQQNLSEIAQVRNRRREAGPDMVEVVRIWLQEDPAYPTFDMAIRFWARKDPAVAALVRRTDDEWIGLLQAIFQANGEGELASLARARITYFHQIGYYALAIEESLEDRLALSPYYHAVLTGTAGGSALEGLISELRSAPSAKS
jgi:AcrR family transcriptional regulator